MKTDITHVFDYESNEDVHTTQFHTTLDRMKVAQSLGKEIKYHNGYSNFTFELWMILHKIDSMEACELFSISRHYDIPNRVAFNRIYASYQKVKAIDA